MNHQVKHTTVWAAPANAVPDVLAVVPLFIFEDGFRKDRPDRRYRL